MAMAPRQLVVLGDSGVHGWGDRLGGGWCERLRLEWMGLPDAPVIYPLGVRGDGLEAVSARWHSEWSCRGELRRQRPDGVLLSVGLNDTARIGRPNGRPQLSEEAYAFGMGQLLEAISRDSSVLVIGMTPVDDHVMPFADCLWYANPMIERYEAVLAETCRDHDVPFLTMHRPLLSEPNWLSWLEPDGIHLNAEGHAWMHQRLRQWTALLDWAGLQPLKTLTPNAG